MTMDPAVATTGTFTDAALLAQLHRFRLMSTTDVSAKPAVPAQTVSALLALSRRTDQPVRATLTKVAAGPGTDVHGTGTLRASHVIRFVLNQGRRTTERYVRFVRAAKIVTAGVGKETLRLSHTAGGYVSYVDVAREAWGRRQPDRTSLVRKINELFETAKWSFDGPRDEFRSGNLTAVDEPGVRTFGVDLYPILQRFDFIGVLYDPPETGPAAGILNVTYYQDSFIALSKESPVERLKPLPV
jgi:hypothetical protein